MKKTIIISGGSDGLGKEIARLLSKQHAIIILAPNKTKVEKVASELSCDFQICDVSNYSDIEKAIKNIVAKYNSIDCLVNNAGIWIEGELDTNEPDRIKRVIEVNTTGTLLLTRAVLPLMKKNKKGLIINIISQAGISAKAERAIYNASKWALTGFTKSLQVEVSKYGVGVTGIYPGKLKTPLFEKVGIKKDMSDGLDPVEVAKTVEFVVSSSDTTLFPEIGIKHIKS